MSFDMHSIENALRYSMLKNDVIHIISLYDMECNQDMDPARFMLKHGQYQSPVSMYNDIMKVVYELGYVHCHIELMPYIDDYLEYFFAY